MVLFKLAERSLGLISTVILARLLVPADFGLVAMAMSVIAVIEVASAFSFEIALIQREHVGKGALRHRVDAEYRARDRLCFGDGRSRVPRRGCCTTSRDWRRSCSSSREAGSS